MSVGVADLGYYGDSDLGACDVVDLGCYYDGALVYLRVGVADLGYYGDNDLGACEVDLGYCEVVDLG